VIHETLHSNTPGSSIISLPTAYLQASSEGFRSRDPDTLKKDLGLLKQSLAKGENCSRTVFHLGVFSEEAQDDRGALKYFEQRALMGGWDQEVFYSLFRVAFLEGKLGFSPEIFIAHYLRAYTYRPSRIEPLVALACYYLRKENFTKAYPLLKQVVSIPLSQDAIYVMVPLYEYWALFLLADVAYQLGYHEESWQISSKLLSLSSLPESERAHLEKQRLIHNRI
jgi:hypothetical protein